MNNAMINPYAFPGMKMNLGIIKHREISLPRVMDMIADYCSVSSEDIKGKKRFREIVECRMIFCYLSRNCLKKTYKQIGELIDRDHTTIIHSVNTITDLIQINENMAELVRTLTAKMWEIDEVTIGNPNA